MSIKLNIMALQIETLLSTTKAMLERSFKYSKSDGSIILDNFNKQINEIEKMKFDLIVCQNTGCQIDDDNPAVDIMSIYLFLIKNIGTLMEMSAETQYPLTRNAREPYGGILRLEYLCDTPPADQLEVLTPPTFDLIFEPELFNSESLLLRTVGGIDTGSVKEEFKSIVSPDLVISQSAWNSAERHLTQLIDRFKLEKEKR